MIAFEDAASTRLPARQYADFTRASIEAAQRRVWVSTFLCDLRPSRDLEGRVLDLIRAVVQRQAWGVDVRVLLTGHVGTPDIAVANLASGLFLEGYRVAHRRVVREPEGNRLGSHAKFVIFDQHAIVGSQNWTDDGFRLNLEDAVILTGESVELLAEEFLRLWRAGRGVPRADAD